MYSWESERQTKSTLGRDQLQSREGCSLSIENGMYAAAVVGPFMFFFFFSAYSHSFFLVDRFSFLFFSAISCSIVLSVLSCSCFRTEAKFKFVSIPR